MRTEKATFTQKLQVWAYPTDQYTRDMNPDSPAFEYKVCTDKPWNSGAVMVHEEEVSLTVPAGVDLTTAAIATLEAAIKEVEDRDYQEIESLRQQIKNLVCLEHQPTTEPELESGPPQGEE